MKLLLFKTARFAHAHLVASASYASSMEGLPEKKRKRLSLKCPEKNTLDSITPEKDAEKKRKPLELKTPENRFAFTSAEAIEEAQKDYVPANTKKATEWSLRVFHTWKVAHNDAASEQCPDNILLSEDLSRTARTLMGSLTRGNVSQPLLAQHSNGRPQESY